MYESFYRYTQRLQHPVRRRERRTNRGEIKPGSSSDQVLNLLKEEHPKYLTRAQIVKRLDVPPKSIDWSLNYLQALGKIRGHSALDKRSPLYKQYQYRDERNKA